MWQDGMQRPRSIFPGTDSQAMQRRDILKAISALPLASIRGFGSNMMEKRYEANWASIDSRPIPQWYTDAKFGIFIHWGVYSVPAFAPVHKENQTAYAEWYWHSLNDGKKAKTPDGPGGMTWEFHKRVYGADFPYFDFAPMFRAELFDADKWADLFARSGAKYVALTSKHHEGFTLWKSAEANRSWGRPWNAVDIGPKRDLLSELSDAGRKKGLEMGIYYSLYEWFNPLWLSDRQRYVKEHLFPQFKDVVTRAKPSIIFSDGEWEMSSEEWHSPELMAWLFNDSIVKDHVVIDDRWGKDTRHKHGGYYTTEYTAGMQAATHPWEESRGMGFSYGYNRVETLKDYHTERELLMMLIDIVSRGGNLLLDIGPRADGGIPTIMEERLVQMGSWLGVNGESIYGTHAAKRTRQWSQGTLPKMEDKEFQAAYEIGQMVDTPPAGYARVDAFFTAKDDTTYAILPRWPEQPIVLEGLSAQQGWKVILLETGDTLQAQPDGNRLKVDVPQSLRGKMPFRQAYVLKMQGVNGA
jgi:alpha-L-fucosidase